MSRELFALQLQEVERRIDYATARLSDLREAGEHALGLEEMLTVLTLSKEALLLCADSEMSVVHA
jgi:hypothetical protein